MPLRTCCATSGLRARSSTYPLLRVLYDRSFTGPQSVRGRVGEHGLAGGREVCVVVDDRDKI
jgi:hypothetical protein